MLRQSTTSSLIIGSHRLVAGVYTKVSKQSEFCFDLFGFLCLSTCLENRYVGQINSVRQKTRPIANFQATAPLSRNVTLPDTLSMTAGVPNLSAADYCARHGRL